MLIFSRIWLLFTVFNQIRLKNYQIKKNKIFNFSHKISQKRHFVAQKRQFSSSVSRKWPSGETTWRQKPAAVPLEAWSPMTLWMGGRRQPDGMSEANLQRLHPRRALQRTKWRFNATTPPSWEFFPWVKTPNSRTTWRKFRPVVSRKRFSTHGIWSVENVTGMM